jgi:hypothetical protein
MNIVHNYLASNIDGSFRGSTVESDKAAEVKIIKTLRRMFGLPLKQQDYALLNMFDEKTTLTGVTSFLKERGFNAAALIAQRALNVVVDKLCNSQILIDQYQHVKEEWVVIDDKALEIFRQNFSALSDNVSLVYGSFYSPGSLNVAKFSSDKARPHRNLFNIEHARPSAEDFYAIYPAVASVTMARDNPLASNLFTDYRHIPDAVKFHPVLSALSRHYQRNDKGVSFYLFNKERHESYKGDSFLYAFECAVNKNMSALLNGDIEIRSDEKKKALMFKSLARILIKTKDLSAFITSDGITQSASVGEATNFNELREAISGSYDKDVTPTINKITEIPWVRGSDDNLDAELECKLVELLEKTADDALVCISAYDTLEEISASITQNHQNMNKEEFHSATLMLRSLFKGNGSLREPSAHREFTNTADLLTRCMAIDPSAAIGFFNLAPPSLIVSVIKHPEFDAHFLGDIVEAALRTHYRTILSLKTDYHTDNVAEILWTAETMYPGFLKASDLDIIALHKNSYHIEREVFDVFNSRFNSRKHDSLADIQSASEDMSFLSGGPI